MEFKLGDEIFYYDSDKKEFEKGIVTKIDETSWETKIWAVWENSMDEAYMTLPRVEEDMKRYALFKYKTDKVNDDRVPMTVAAIEKILGYKISIVG